MKTLIKMLIAFLLLLTASTIALLLVIFVDFHPASPLPKGPVEQINDVTQLNPITVTKVVIPKTEQDIVLALTHSEGKVSVGGARNSQGGQTAFPDSLHLDMRQYNDVIHLDPDKQQVTVESGIRWRELQKHIDPHDLAIRIMQSYANFTVGGSLSVNAHGRYIGEGAIIRSVESFRLVLADGTVKQVSETSEPELFFAAIGGYGGLGVISQVTLNLAENVKVKRQSEDLTIEQYPNFFKQKIRDNKKVVFHNADLFPPHYRDIRSVSWIKTEESVTEKLRLIPEQQDYSWQPQVAEFVAEYEFGKWLRQHVLEPVLYAFDTVHWRNYEASYDIRELEPKSRREYTYALREYFIPVNNIESFVPKMATIFSKHRVNVLNVSIRHALPDPGSYLAWAQQEVFAFVVYYRQGTNEDSKQSVSLWSKAMIDAAISEGGTYYLPYQLHASTAQFYEAYPQAKKYYDIKSKYDPQSRFQNMLINKHQP